MAGWRGHFFFFFARACRTEHWRPAAAQKPYGFLYHFYFLLSFVRFCLTLIPNPRSHDWNTGFIVTLAAPLRRPFSGSSTFHCKCAGKYVSLDVSVLIACDAEGQEGIFKRKSFPHFPQRYTLCVVSVTDLIFFFIFYFFKGSNRCKVRGRFHTSASTESFSLLAECELQRWNACW